MIHPHEGGITIDVLVQPRASRPRVGPVHGDRIKVAVTSPPVDGAANKAVVELLAKQLGVPRGGISVVSGHSSRRKRVRIDGASATDLEELLA
jgi:hypothetical protein